MPNPVKKKGKDDFQYFWLSIVPNFFLVKSTVEHKTTKSSHKMPNPVKKTEKDDFQYFWLRGCLPKILITEIDHKIDLLQIL